MSTRLLWIVLLAGLLCVPNLTQGGERILVPDPRGVYPLTIQEGIDRARDGDTVLVADGIYDENIRFDGRKIIVASFDLLYPWQKHVDVTVIRGNSHALRPMPVVLFGGGEDTRSVLLGFTIEGGKGARVEYRGVGYTGGGVAVLNAGATIARNVIRRNGVAGFIASGGGIGVFNTAAGFKVVIESNIIEDNTAAGEEMGIGGGVFAAGAAVDLLANRIKGNAATGRWVWGGGADLEDPACLYLPINVDANDIALNRAQGEAGAWGGGLMAWNGSLLVKGNVVAGNTAEGRSLVAAGGGMHLEGANGGVSCRVLANILERNVATNGTGVRPPRVVHGEYEEQSPVSGGFRGGADLVLAALTGGQTEAAGGGMNAFGVDLTLAGNVFRANTVVGREAGFGAAAQVTSLAQTSGMKENVFELNTAGGAECLGTVHVLGCREMRVCEGTFRDNNVTIGGGLAFTRSGFRVENSVFMENSAMYGGAIFAATVPEGAPTVTRRTTVNGRPGGGKKWAEAVPQDAPPPHLTVVNCTMVGNAGAYGRSVYADRIPERSPLLVFNSILWSGSPQERRTPEGLEVATHEATVAVAYSNLASGYYDGVGNISRPPQLYNAGSELALLHDDSPCIGAGIGSVDVAGHTFDAPMCDCHGHCRPQPDGSNPDMGAEESRLARPRPAAVVKLSDAALRQNFPNPFNPMTSIRYDVAEASRVTMKVYDLLGREVATLVDEMREPGSYEVRWDASAVASGMYMYTMRAGAFTETRRLVVVR